MLLMEGYFMNKFKKMFFLMTILFLGLSNYSNVLGMDPEIVEMRKEKYLDSKLPKEVPTSFWQKHKKSKVVAGVTLAAVVGLLAWKRLQSLHKR